MNLTESQKRYVEYSFKSGMRLTNKLNLPLPFIDALLADDYDRGESDYSVSEIIQPSQITHLKRKHKKEIIEDASDMIYVLLGRSVHAILEKSTTNELPSLAEKRLFINREGLAVSGKLDWMCLESGILHDYKVMSVWEFIYGLSDEKTAQLNLYSLIVKENGFEVSGLKIVGLFRDWQKSKAKDDGYPDRQIVLFPIPRWSPQIAEDYLATRLTILKSGYEPCSDKDRWYTGNKWAVMEMGKKKASRVLDSEDLAYKYLQNQIKGKNARIDFRKGVNRRCEDYCIVKDFCEQYKKSKGE